MPATRLTCLTLSALMRFVGFQIMITPAALGTASLTSSSHLPPNTSPVASDSPVMLPPDLARLRTNPEAAGSPERDTMGMARVSRAAAAATGVPGVTSTSTRRSISSWRRRGTGRASRLRSGTRSRCSDLRRSRAHEVLAGVPSLEAP